MQGAQQPRTRCAIEEFLIYQPEPYMDYIQDQSVLYEAFCEEEAKIGKPQPIKEGVLILYVKGMFH